MVEEKQEAKQEKKESKSKVELTQVVTATDLAFKLPDGDVVSMQEYLVWLGNKVIEISKAVA